MWEQDPGRQRQGTTTIPRPIANVAYEVKVDNGNPIPLQLDGACIATATANIFTCKAFLPPMTEGSHTIEIRAFPNPSETGVTPHPGYSTPITAIVLVVTAPAVPASVRIGEEQ